VSRLLEGKSAVITGAASGIGRAAAFAFSREGARVMLADVNVEEAERAAAEITAAGGEARSIRTDVSQEDDVASMVRETISAFGGLDCALNNAGITGPMGAVQHIALEDFERVTSINMIGVFLCMKHEIAAMADGGGSIVNIGPRAHEDRGRRKRPNRDSSERDLPRHHRHAHAAGGHGSRPEREEDDPLRPALRSSGRTRRNRRSGCVVVLRPSILRHRRVDARRRRGHRSVIE